jgi:hypothetical protein
MRYTIALSVYQWLLIKETLQSDVYMDAVNDDPRKVVELGKGAIKLIEDNAYGADRMPRPLDQIIQIELSGRQIVMITEALTRWATVADESIPAVSEHDSKGAEGGYFEPVEDGAEMWEVLRVLRAQLGPE